MNSRINHRFSQSNTQGVAIVIVLAFVVLLTGLVVAFFSGTVTQRQLSNAGFEETNVDLLARSAVDIITGDLKEEIRRGSEVVSISAPTVVPAGSPAPSPAPSTPPLRDIHIYYPTEPADMVPKRAGNPTGNPNYIRRSWSGDTTLPVGSRASNSPTTTASHNDRVVSPLRWNLHGLNPLQAPTSTTDLTPAAATFNAPDWVIVTKNGPKRFTGWTNDLRDSGKNDFAVGRYAYVIYDEGGTLDVNLAGYPQGTTTGYSGSTLDQYGRKTSLHYADLTVIPGITDATVDKIVEWRNYASRLNDADDFDDYLFQDNTGFLQTSTKTHTDQTDKAFTSRQTLLKFWKDQNPALPLQSLQHLGTFSRGLNQPSFRLDPDQPLPNPAPSPAINPPFLEVRNPQNALQPLVNQRFPLKRLAWLTCEGPFATISSSSLSGDIQAALLNAGYNQLYLNLGTAARVKDYFGLEWDNVERRWFYRPDGATVSNTIATLDAITTREPNFIELLKAAVNTGATGIGGTASAEQGSIDIVPDHDIIQIAANIIDQFDVDAFPTRIDFNGKSFFGIENLPYIYRVRSTVAKRQRPSPDAISDAPVVEDPANPLTSPGEAIVFLQPELWNPHHPAATTGVTALRPSSFEFYTVTGLPATTTPPNATLATPRNSFSLTTLATSTFKGATVNSDNTDDATILPTPSPSAGWYTGLPLSLTRNEARMEFTAANVTTASTFREPSLLWEAAPLNVSIAGTPAVSPSRLSQLSSNVRDIDDTSGRNFLGIYLGSVPLRWIVDDTSTSPAVRNIVSAEHISVEAPAGEFTVTLAYIKDGNSYPYDRKFINNDFFGTSAPVRGLQNISWPSADRLHGLTQNVESWASVIDPRTGRFGMFFSGNSGVYAPAFNTSVSPDYIVDSARPDARGGTSLAAFGGIPAGANWTVAAGFPGFLQNNISGRSTFFTDRDGVTRRGMAGQNTGTAETDPTTGMPLAWSNFGTATENLQNRPVILDRPFRSVGELGYVFSGVPWRHLDMSTQESAYSALLDVFCIQDTLDLTDPNNPVQPSITREALVAGKVNINTRNPVALAAIISGALTDEVRSTRTAGEVSVDTEASSTLANGIANLLVTRTGGTTATSGQGPLYNLAHLTGRWITTPAQNGSTAFRGFSEDLVNTTVFTGTLPAATAVPAYIPRLKEATIRALSNLGETRVWNLMIDVVAQTGRYPLTADALPEFSVEAEKRYWVHLAIDRYTGEVLDRKIEVVKE